MDGKAAAGIEPAARSWNRLESLRVPRPTLWRSPPETRKPREPSRGLFNWRDSILFGRSTGLHHDEPSGTRTLMVVINYLKIQVVRRREIRGRQTGVKSTLFRVRVSRRLSRGVTTPSMGFFLRRASPFKLPTPDTISSTPAPEKRKPQGG